jgi:hypothetical protein
MAIPKLDPSLRAREIMPERVDALVNSVNQHTTEIALIRGDLSGLRHDMEMISGAFGQQGQKLDTLLSSVSSLQATKPGAPMENLRNGISIMQSIAFLVGAVVAGVVYISSNANNAELAVMKEKISALSERVGWHAGTEVRLSKPAR